MNSIEHRSTGRVQGKGRTCNTPELNADTLGPRAIKATGDTSFEVMSKHARITVGLTFHSPNSDNFGVGALTRGHLAILEGIAQSTQTELCANIVGWVDEREYYIDGPSVSIVPVRGRDFVAFKGGLHAALRRCDLVCDIGGGDSFADIYGSKRFGFLTLSKLVALIARRPLILSPQTIGPFDRRWTRWIATWLMNRCRAVVVRDHASFEYASQLGVRSPLVDATDVAFRLPFARPRRRREDLTLVGLNVSGLLFNGGYNRSNMFALKADYPRLVRKLLKRLVEWPQSEVHLISHVISDTQTVEDDSRVAEQLASEVPGAIVAPRFANPSDAKSYIAGMDFFCGSRMHACIAAFSSGVPVVPIAYSRKFSGLFESLDYPFVADCRSETEDEIVEKVVRGFGDRERLRERVRAGTAIAEAKLASYEALLRQCFSEVAATKQ